MVLWTPCPPPSNPGGPWTSEEEFCETVLARVSNSTSALAHNFPPSQQLSQTLVPLIFSTVLPLSRVAGSRGWWSQYRLRPQERPWGWGTEARLLFANLAGHWEHEGESMGITPGWAAPRHPGQLGSWGQHEDPSLPELGCKEQLSGKMVLISFLFHPQPKGTREGVSRPCSRPTVSAGALAAKSSPSSVLHASHFWGVGAAVLCGNGCRGVIFQHMRVLRARAVLLGPRFWLIKE